MRALASFLRSSVGLKVLMGLTGLAWVGFLVGHLAGNLLLYVSPEAFNEYSHTLISNPLVYVAEALLLVTFLAHFVSGITVWRRNRSARRHPYHRQAYAGHTSRKSWASTTMIYSGIIVLIFVPLHIVTFKFGPWYETAGGPPMRDLYRLVLEVFHDPVYVAWYALAMIVIGFHLWHGFASAFESLSFAYRRPLRRFGQILALILAAGFLSFPVVIFVTGGRL